MRTCVGAALRLLECDTQGGITSSRRNNARARKAADREALQRVGHKGVVQVGECAVRYGSVSQYCAHAATGERLHLAHHQRAFLQAARLGLSAVSM